MSNYETLNVSVAGTIGEIVLNRPDKLNALSTQLLREIIAAARWFDTQTAVKAVIIRGEGRVFSAGADLNDWRQAGRSTGNLGIRRL